MARVLTDKQAVLAEAMATKANEHEQVLLACAIRNPLIAMRLVAELQPADFTQADHRCLLDVMKYCVDRQQRVTKALVVDVVRHQGLGDLLSLTYLDELDALRPAERDVPYAMKRVMDTSERRQLIAAARTIAAFALDMERVNPTSDALDALIGVNEHRAEEHLRHISEVMAAHVKGIQAASEATLAGEPPLAETGFPALDARIILGAGKLLVVGARPGMGKTSFGAQIAKHVAEKRPVLIASLEMDGEEMAARWVAADLKINAHDQAAGRIESQEAWKKLYDLPTDYADLKLYISDAPSATIASIEVAAMRVAAKEKARMGLIVIDYLGLIDGDGKDEVSKISAITKAAKALARRMRCPVILLCQLNRGVESRENKRPLLADIRSSGSVEQDADIVLFLYRDDYYSPESPKKGVAEVLIPKNRGGKAGVAVELYWQAEETRFESIGFKHRAYNAAHDNTYGAAQDAG